MKSAIAGGPVFGSALFVSPGRRQPPPAGERRKSLTQDSEKAAPVLRTRRQIGVGARAIIVTNPARATPRRAIIPPTAKRGRAMTRTTMYASLIGTLLFSAAAFGISAAVDTPRTLMARGDYTQARQAIDVETRVSLARCRGVDGSTRDVCKAEVRAEERIKKADLDARYHGTVTAAENAKLARVKAHYDIAKARCGAFTTDQRAGCLQSARTEKAKGFAEAKLAST
jgi:hypothetical protein